ncbi:MAG: hypothetical protein KKF33_08170 [Alphaproteobacteria bacterium]|nr:hypothetical protein [Alphaproteobacteria bacterium]
MFPAASPETSPAATPAVSTGKANLASLVVVLAYCALLTLLALGHAPSLDEAQGWLVATTINRPIDFFILPSEGHPPLWHWLLRLLSLGMDLPQARFMTLGFGLLNAFLLRRLLQGTPLLLAMLLFSFVGLQSWGYYFRPYPLIMTGIVCTLLLNRSGRQQAASWVLAVTCGLHFFVGFLFAFWLLWQWRQGVRLRALIGPSLLAACFGAMAVLSALGNSTAGNPTIGILDGTLANLAWTAMYPQLRLPVVAVVTMALLGFGLRKTPYLAVTLLATLLVFAVATAALYALYPWHLAFMTMLCFMAFQFAGAKASHWVLPLLLFPQVEAGLISVFGRLQQPNWAEPDIYAIIKADAGTGFDPARQLVAWPDIAGISTVAMNHISMTSGNNGAMLGPIDWRGWQVGDMDPALLTRPRPFWLLCSDCDMILAYLATAGAAPTQIGYRRHYDNSPITAYRID